jgi:hypothetical protein
MIDEIKDAVEMNTINISVMIIVVVIIGIETIKNIHAEAITTNNIAIETIIIVVIGIVVTGIDITIRIVTNIEAESIIDKMAS